MAGQTPTAFISRILHPRTAGGLSQPRQSTLGAIGPSGVTFLLAHMVCMLNDPALRRCISSGIGPMFLQVALKERSNNFLPMILLSLFT